MKKLILIALFVLLSLPLRAQGPQWIVYNTSNSNIPTKNILSVILEGDTTWLGSDSGAIRMINGNWTYYSIYNSEIPSNNIYKIAIDPNGRKLMGTLGSGASVFDGDSWVSYNTSNSPLPYNIVFGVDFDLYDNMWMVTPFGAAKTDGTSWEVYNSSIFSSLINVNRIKINRETNVKYIGTNYSGLCVYNDTNWINYNTKNSDISSDGIKDIEIDSTGNLWIATTDNGVSKYNLQDSTWSQFLPGFNALCIAIDDEKGNWVGTGGGGIYKYSGNTILENFRPENSPLPSHTINDLTYDRFGNLLIATSQGLVIYNENGVVGITNLTESFPNSFILYHNYPNPFNPSTRIKFAIPKSGSVRLWVFDQLGREVQTLVNEELTVGSYEYEFDGSELASGVYFYRLEAGENTQTKRMILLK